MAVDVSKWFLVDEDFDLQPEPGAFINMTRAFSLVEGRPEDAEISLWQDYEINGETVNALNWCHATYVWLWAKLEKRGRDRNHCDYCNHYVRYVNIYCDDAGDAFMVGRDCHELISAKLADGVDFDRSAFYEAKRQSERYSKIREKMTTNGLRFTYSQPIHGNEWLWNIPKSARPAFVSFWKTPDYGDWWFTIWGESRMEVMTNFDNLMSLKDVTFTPDVDRSEFVGELGVRTTFENLKVVQQYEKETDYGRVYVTLFDDENGNHIQHAGAGLEGVVKVGDIVTLVATVKRHNEWKGKKTTHVNRPKVK